MQHFLYAIRKQFLVQLTNIMDLVVIAFLMCPILVQKL